MCLVEGPLRDIAPFSLPPPLPPSLPPSPRRALTTTTTRTPNKTPNHAIISTSQLDVRKQDNVRGRDANP